MNQKKIQTRVFCAIFVLMFSIGLVSVTSSVICQSKSFVQLNSNYGKTISVNSDIARGGSTIVANGNYAYLLGDYVGLEIYDVSNKDEIEDVGSFSYAYELTMDYSDLIVHNGYFYFFSQEINRVTILDCSDVSNIVVRANYTLPDAYYTKIAVLDWNILTLTSTEFSIYNFTDFSPVSLIDSYTNASASFSDLTVQGNYSFILDSNYGLAIFNITDSTNILKEDDLVLNETSNYKDFYVADDYVYIYEDGKGLHICDISNPLDPSNVTLYEIYGYTIQDLLIKNNNAFVLYSDYFDILNVSNLLDIQLIGTYTTEYFTGFESFCVDGNFAYIRNTHSGELQGTRPLYVVDISNLELPVHVYPGDPFQFLSDIVKLFLIIVGSVLGVIIIILAIVILQEIKNEFEDRKKITCFFARMQKVVVGKIYNEKIIHT
ncbi:MAG: hypothetical protein GPJ52_15450 [Candidatus Heimdallarchaeota archaeon]|nr:hypothetical protein [Candidatus Heimdallarchaeota archaeon]